MTAFSGWSNTHIRLTGISPESVTMATTTSIGTILKVNIASTMTAIAGIRNVDFDPGEVETMEIDDLDDDFVNLDVTGRASGGEVTAELFRDFAAASQDKLAALWDAPAKESFQIVYPDADDSTQPFTGILTKFPVKSERGNPLMSDISIKVATKPTLIGVS